MRTKYNFNPEKDNSEVIKNYEDHANNSIFFEGEITEAVIADILKQLNSFTGVSKNVLARIKVAVIELCSNVIAHHSGTAYGKVVINSGNYDYTLSVSSFVNSKDLEIIGAILSSLQSQNDARERYYNLLEKVGTRTGSAKLGLVKVFDICHGKIMMDSSMITSKILITFRVSFDDNN